RPVQISSLQKRERRLPVASVLSKEQDKQEVTGVGCILQLFSADVEFLSEKGVRLAGPGA
ncbi:MAG TPA: hypothetical protein VGF28_02535, partial [Thermoanaerobaculia bacterium]